MAKVELPAYIRGFFGIDVFSQIMQLQGRVFREVAGRRTVQVMLGNDSYFVKQHFGVGWKEIFKSFLSFKVPIAVADLARKLHQNGLNHRDFYLCHLCLDVQALQQDQIKLSLIDLHRMQISAKPRLKAIMKDIAGLYFSTMDVGLTARDFIRFKHHYAIGFSFVVLKRDF